MPSTSSLNSSMIQWVFVASLCYKVVAGVLLYTFAAELDMDYHRNLGENQAPTWSVRQAFYWIWCTVHRLQKYRTVDKGQPSPAIRTPRRSGWSSVTAVNILGVVAKGHWGGRLRLNGDPRAITGIRRAESLPAHLKSTLLLQLRSTVYKLSPDSASFPCYAPQCLSNRLNSAWELVQPTISPSPVLSSTEKEHPCPALPWSVITKLLPVLVSLWSLIAPRCGNLEFGRIPSPERTPVL
jgi:hypothetical protein